MKRDDRGMVTAELAVLMPFGVAFGFLLCWIVSLGVTQVRLVDASREAARMVARGDAEGLAESAAREHAPRGTDFEITTTDGLVTVTATARSGMSSPLFAHIGSVRLKAEAVSAAESG